MVVSIECNSTFVASELSHKLVCFADGSEHYVAISVLLNPAANDLAHGGNHVHLEVNDQSNSAYQAIASVKFEKHGIELILNRAQSARFEGAESIWIELPVELDMDALHAVSELKAILAFDRIPISIYEP